MSRSTIVTKQFCCVFMLLCLILSYVQRQQFKDESFNLRVTACAGLDCSPLLC